MAVEVSVFPRIQNAVAIEILEDIEAAVAVEILLGLAQEDHQGRMRGSQGRGTAYCAGVAPAAGAFGWRIDPVLPAAVAVEVAHRYEPGQGRQGPAVVRVSCSQDEERAVDEAGGKAEQGRSTDNPGAARDRRRCPGRTGCLVRRCGPQEGQNS